MNKPSRINNWVLDFENAVEDLLKREVKEEAGLEIEGQMQYVNSMAFVRPDETPVVFIKFAAKYKSGEVKPEPGSFTDFAWVNAEEVKNYPCIKGIPEKIEKTIAIFSNLKTRYRVNTHRT